MFLKDRWPLVGGRGGVCKSVLKGRVAFGCG